MPPPDRITQDFDPHIPAVHDQLLTALNLEFLDYFSKKTLGLVSKILIAPAKIWDNPLK